MVRVARVAALAILFAVTCFARLAFAHVGSPDVFYEGDAGPYHLFVTVNVPPVIPGVAEVQIRTESTNVSQISTVVTRLTGVGSKYAPVPDLAVRSTADPHLFTSSIWLMEYGSLRVMLNVKGSLGSAEMSVPVASFARKSLTMPLGLGALLLALAVGLAVGAISIVGAAARDSRLKPGALPNDVSRRSGRIAMGVTAAIVAAIFYFAFDWWNVDAQAHARLTQFFKPPPLTLTLLGNDRLKVQAANSEWSKDQVMDTLLPDHGHLMHLFLVREPGFDRFWHLHPERDSNGSFIANLPPLDAGHYDVFADLVDQSGFPWTLVGSINLPQLNGTTLSSDDSGGSFPELSDNASTTDVLPDGTRVVWQHGPLQANTPLVLHFVVQNADGSPAADLKPYMGMAAHLEIVRSDLSVFAHIHPSGSAPMAALMLASNDKGAGNSDGMAGMTMPGMKMPEKVEPEFSMPYGFPKPGLYRVFVQFKRGDKVETAVFDTEVR